jgi:hypothetical protein
MQTTRNIMPVEMSIMARGILAAGADFPLCNVSDRRGMIEFLSR